MAFQFNIAQPPIYHNSLLSDITALGLTTGLKLALDAGDAASYTSGQSWLDRSGGGYDFFRGSSASSQASDPTFVGSAGGQSSGEYWSFDGGDYFTYDTTSETWMNALHKDGALWSLAMWYYHPGSGGADLVDTAGSSMPGIELSGTIDALTLDVGNDAGTAISKAITTGLNTAAGWKFLSLSIDEAGNAIRGNFSGAVYSSTFTYSTPSANAASIPMKLMATANGALPAPSGARLSTVAMWQGVALSAAQLDSIFTRSRAKYGV